MDNNSDFSSPEYDLMLAGPAFVPEGPVPEGSYYWRVAVVRGGESSSWSTPAVANSMTLPDFDGANATEELDRSASPAWNVDWRLLGIDWKLQCKDTKMVCRKGDHETAGVEDIGDTLHRTLNAPWDLPHPETGA